MPEPQPDPFMPPLGSHRAPCSSTSPHPPHAVPIDPPGCPEAWCPGATRADYEYDMATAAEETRPRDDDPRDRLTGLDVLAASMADDAPSAGEVPPDPEAMRTTAFVRRRMPECPWVGAHSRHLFRARHEDGEIYRVACPGVSATPPAGADEVRAAIRTDEARGAIDGALGKLKADVSPDRRRFVADLIMDRVVAPIIRERDQARELMSTDIAVTADRTVRAQQEADEQRQRADHHAEVEAAALKGWEAERQRADRAEADLERSDGAFNEMYALGMRTANHGDRYRLAWQSARRRAATLVRVARERDDAYAEVDRLNFVLGTWSDIEKSYLATVEGRADDGTGGGSLRSDVHGLLGGLHERMKANGLIRDDGTDRGETEAETALFEMPIGTPVRYWPGDRVGEGTVSRTRSEVWTLGGHTPVVEIWSRRFVRPRVKLTRPARPHPIAAWNRYGAIPGTPYRGVTIGVEVALRGRGLSIRWARPVVHTVPALDDTDGTDGDDRG